MSKAANPKKLNKDLAAFCKELHVFAPADKDMDKMVTSINKAKDSLGIRGNQGPYDDMINTFIGASCSQYTNMKPASAKLANELKGIQTLGVKNSGDLSKGVKNALQALTESQM